MKPAVKPKRELAAFPPLSQLACAWAEDAMDHKRAGRHGRAMDAARKAIEAHERFGDGEEPAGVKACREMVRDATA